jgi:glycosyltransferase involved in cell wall biosynthesis
MKVSVIIPTHNRIKQLQQAYQSVCNQSIKPAEIIIIDDASEKNLDAQKMQLNHSDINTIIERFEIPQGACKARNRGAEIASGDLLMFLDDDDTWETEKISAQLQIFQNNSEVGLVYSGRLMVSESNRDRIIYRIKPKFFGQLYPQILYNNLIGCTSSVAIRKSIFQAVNGFDENLPALQDYELWIRLCQKTLVGHDDSYHVRYTISENPTAQISGKSDRYIQATERLLVKHQQEITLQGAISIRKVRANLYFFVAKSLRYQGIIPALYWIIKSFMQYPNLKVWLLIIPIKIRQLLQKFRANYYKKLLDNRGKKKVYFDCS